MGGGENVGDNHENKDAPMGDGENVGDDHDNKDAPMGDGENVDDNHENSIDVFEIVADGGNVADD